MEIWGRNVDQVTHDGAIKRAAERESPYLEDRAAI